MNVTLDNTIVLTERLLQLSVVKRKEQGERQFAPVDLVQVVQNCCFSRLAQARSKAIDLGYDGVQQPVMIEQAQAVDKSYPSFWEEYNKRGGKTHELHLRP